MGPEELLQIACADFTRLCCPTVLLSASQNGLYLGGGRYVGDYIIRQKRRGLLPGELDLMLTWPEKNILFIELKSKTGRLTDAQEDVMSRRIAQGFDCVVANSFDLYVNFLISHNVPMRRMIYAGKQYGEPL